MELKEKQCVPCERGMPALDRAAADKLLGQVRGWSLREGEKAGAQGASAPASAAGPRITKRFKFDDFLGAMAFVDKMAALAEEQGHHPDFCVHYSQVDVTLWTHAVEGLSENDFILASKIDAVLA